MSDRKLSKQNKHPFENAVKSFMNSLSELQAMFLAGLLQGTISSGTQSLTVSCFLGLLEERFSTLDSQQVNTLMTQAVRAFTDLNHCRCQYKYDVITDFPCQLCAFCRSSDPGTSESSTIFYSCELLNIAIANPNRSSCPGYAEKESLSDCID